ncbi:MAG: ADP-ribosylglycohydrolase family protein [Synergistetes bacterium]|nr:ADP-ribosylglycohydrolase family protein [Synergistota bacterium]
MGLAIGDALGMPFEGKERKYIQGKWDGVSFLSRKGLLPGEWTDDTEMALIHAESLIKCGKVDVEDLSLRFVRWLESGKAVTQGIGKTTREAILRMRNGVPPQEAGRKGKWAAGNGGAMRIAPIGLFYCNRRDVLLDEVRVAVSMTHNNEDAIRGALAIAYVIAEVASGRTPVMEDIVSFIGECNVSSSLGKVDELLLQQEYPYDELRNSAYVVDSVPLSVYCFLKHADDFESALRCAIFWGGDTDTSAAMVGAMSGAHVGMCGIPDVWIKGLRNLDFIVDVSDRLYLKVREEGIDGGSKG